jgi:hypothetical protein
MASTLLDLCLDAAASREGWQVVQSQHDALRALPPELADELLQRLLDRHALDKAPQQIERFAECATRVSINGKFLECRVVKALAAPLASFQCLQELYITNTPQKDTRWPCRHEDLMPGDVAPLARLAGTLRALSLSGCGMELIEQAGTSTAFLSSLTGLESLGLSARGLPHYVKFDLAGVSALTRLTSLKLAGVPLTDGAARGFERLRYLRELDLSHSWLTPSFVESALGSLTCLTSLRLFLHGRSWECSRGVLPLFANLRRLHLTERSTKQMAQLASVAPVGRSGDVMRLEELVLRGLDIDGPAAVALPQVLRASAPHLRKLDLGDCTLPMDGSVLELLPELVGASQLTCLSIRDQGAILTDAPLPLAALGCTQLAELSLVGPLGLASELGSFLSGVTSLRRLNVTTDCLDSDLEFDDGHLRALAACPLPLLKELDVSETSLKGEFSSDSNPWRQLQGLRRLDISGTWVTSQHALELLGDALGGALTSLRTATNVEPAALAALCSRCTALRKLTIGVWDRPACELEAALVRLPRLERVSVLWGTQKMLDDKAALAQLVARLQPCAFNVSGASGGPYDISEPAEMARMLDEEHWAGIWAAAQAADAADAAAAARRRLERFVARAAAEAAAAEAEAEAAEAAAAEGEQ